MPQHHFENLSAAEIDVIDPVATEFEDRMLAGESPSIESFVENDSVCNELRDALLAELVAVEVGERKRQGQTIHREDYLNRFPKQRHAVLRGFADAFQTEHQADVAPSSQTRMDAGSRPSTTVVGASLSGVGAVDSVGCERVDLEVGAQFGRYQIESRLGEGGMGAVFLAYDLQLKRRVAIKIPKIQDEKTRFRFVRESQAMAALSHPNLCAVYDAGEVEQTAFLSMEYVEGSPLSKRLKSGKLSQAESIAIVAKICRAIQVVHAAGVVHRDLKPANVMMNQAGEPVITDFGLARQANDAGVTQDGMIVGSPAYIAPEILKEKNREASPQSDIYAVGVLLYECLAGRRPYEGDMMSVLSQIATKAPEPLQNVNPEVGGGLQRICARAMHHSPEKRFATATEFAEALEQYKPDLRRPRGKAKKNIRISTIVLLVAILATAIAMQNRGRERAKDQAVSNSPPNVDVAPSASLLPPAPVPSRAGGGYFRDSGQKLGEGYTIAVAAADFDGDSDIDVLATSALKGPHQIWLNNGDATFFAGPSLDSNYSAGSAIGDMDGDGDFDIVTTSRGGAEHLVIWINQGSAEFEKAVLLSGNPDCSDVALGDLDNDGDLDIVLAARMAEGIVLLNDGDANFDQYWDFPKAQDSRRVVLGDFNGDQILDSLFVNAKSADQVWIGDGQGGFEAGPNLGDYDSKAVALVDADKDGDLDALIANADEFGACWINDGKGNFEFLKLLDGIVNGSEVVSADFNGDGLLDRFVAHPRATVLRIPGPNVIALADAEGGFQETDMGALKTSSAVAADFDGDGDLDLFLGNSFHTPNRVWLNEDRP